MSRPRFERFLRNLAHWCTYHNLPWFCFNIALEEGFDQAGKVGFGVLHASQLVGHEARLLYNRCFAPDPSRVLLYHVLPSPSFLMLSARVPRSCTVSFDSPSVISSYSGDKR